MPELDHIQESSKVQELKIVVRGYAAASTTEKYNLRKDIELWTKLRLGLTIVSLRYEDQHPRGSGIVKELND